MIVAVQKGLSHMKNGLAELGFDTVVYGEYKFPIDAIVYRGISSGLMMSGEPNIFNSIFLDGPRRIICDYSSCHFLLYTPL